MWLVVTPRMETYKNVFKRDWIPCSKYDNHSRPNSQHDGGGGPILPCNEHKYLQLMMKRYSHEL